MSVFQCPTCGSPVPQGTTFCSHCGAAVAAPQPAVTFVAAPSPRPQTPVAWRVIRCILSVLTLLVLIPMLVAAVSLYAVRNIASEATAHAVVVSMDILQMEVDTVGEEPATVGDLLYDAYETAYTEAAAAVPLTREAMDEVLERSTLDEFLEDKLHDYVSDLLTDNGAGQIAAEEIVTLLKENEELIAEVSGGYVMQEADYEAIGTAIEDSGLTEALDLSTVKAEAADVLVPVQRAVSTSALLVVAGVCLFLCGLLVLYNLRSRFLGMLYNGLALLLAGGLCALTLLAEGPVVALLAGVGDPFGGAMTSIVHQVLSGFWVPGVCLAVVGLLLLVGFTVLRLVRRRA